jgi:putative endonuclease
VNFLTSSGKQHFSVRSYLKREQGVKLLSNRPSNGIRKAEKPPGDVRKKTGEIGEAIAVDFLKKKGYKIIQRNYSCKLGEVDIIARDGSVLSFIEVKARRSDRFGGPKRALTPRKQRKISMVAVDYLKRTNQMDTEARFDVVAIRLLPGEPDIEVIKNAFDLAY